jgi:hypothetical protein
VNHTEWDGEVLWEGRRDWRWIQITPLGDKWMSNNHISEAKRQGPLHPDYPIEDLHVGDIQAQVVVEQDEGQPYAYFWCYYNQHYKGPLYDRIRVKRQLIVYQPELSWPRGTWEELK